jgi:hypothetical protein
VKEGHRNMDGATYILKYMNREGIHVVVYPALRKDSFLE